MTEQTNTETSLSGLSLADYRAQRESRAEATPAKETKEEAPAGAASEEDALGESEADAGAAEETTEHSEEEKKPAKKGGWQRKIEAREREIEDLKRQLAANKPAVTEAKKEEKPVSEELPKFDKAKPKLEDFESIEAFTDALTDYKADERDWKREQASAQAKAKEESAKVLSDWNQRQAEAKKEHSDYDEVLDSVSDIKLTPAHQRIFLESENGASIAYDLASDPNELKKFAAMNPLAAARYFGKLEAAYDSSEEAPEPETKVSKAPKPIKPVGGRASGAGAFDVSKASLADYRKARESGKLR